MVYPNLGKVIPGRRRKLWLAQKTGRAPTIPAPAGRVSGTAIAVARRQNSSTRQESGPAAAQEAGRPAPQYSVSFQLAGSGGLPPQAALSERRPARAAGRPSAAGRPRVPGGGKRILPASRAPCIAHSVSTPESLHSLLSIPLTDHQLLPTCRLTLPGEVCEDSAQKGVVVNGRDANAAQA